MQKGQFSFRSVLYPNGKRPRILPESFKVVPPGIVIYSQVVEYHYFLKATQR